jgi:hypothetical protein
MSEWYERGRDRDRDRDERNDWRDDDRRRASEDSTGGRSFGSGRTSYDEDRYGGRPSRYSGAYEGYRDESDEGRDYGRRSDEGYGEAYGGRGYGGSSYGRSGYGPAGYGQAGYGQTGYGGTSYADQQRRFAGQGYEPSGYGGMGYGQGAGAFSGRNEPVQRVTEGDYERGHFFGGGMSRPAGEHRGRGPKNYTRSDDRIRDDVNDRLSDDSWLDASEIEVQVAKGEVTLTGTVDSREDKRRAEDIAEAVSGVKHVQNNLRVQAQTATQAGSATSGRATSGATTGTRSSGSVQ